MVWLVEYQLPRLILDKCFQLRFRSAHYSDITWSSWRLESPDNRVGFFNSLWRLTPEKKTNPALLALCEENPPGRASYAGSISMSWRMNTHSPVICSIQSSVVITRSNIVKYYIHNYRTWGRISIRCWIPNGRAMGCFCGYLWENWPRYNGTRLYL